MMKKQYAQIIILAILLLSLVGTIMRCQMRADAPPKEIIEAAEEASAFWVNQGFSPTGKRDDSRNYPVITLARNI